jgi:hypothetical protein
LFALTHQFLQQMIEGDELYTRVNKKVTPDTSQGWTVVLMDRATRFIWDMHCGRKNRKVTVDARVTPHTSASKPCLHVSAHTAPQLLSLGQRHVSS